MGNTFAFHVDEQLEKQNFALGTEVSLRLWAIFCAGQTWGFGTLSQLIVKLDNPCMENQKLAVSTFRGPAASLLAVVTEALYTSCATCT